MTAKGATAPLVERESHAAVWALGDFPTRLAARARRKAPSIEEQDRLLALRQPLARDLRQTISALKIATELERIGDLGKSIAKRVKLIDGIEPVNALKGVARMGRLVTAQLKRVLDAYTALETDAANRVWVRDEEVDEHYQSLFREVVTYMIEDPRTISACAHLLFVAKNLERIGDHCTNIAEEIHFLVTGEQLPVERPKVDALNSH